jgi:LuxR family maltose regulon positive regulatory protein
LSEVVTSLPLTLVSAPAGSGKTTLLAAFAHSYAKSDWPVAWLALDEDDNDLPQLFTALIGTLQKLNPACGQTLLPALNSFTNPRNQVRQLVAALINDIVQSLPFNFVLVLDDLHVIRDETVYAVLNYLLERLPPQMRLVIATRYDPPLALNRLRARGQVAEIRLDELQFTSEETSLFLKESLAPVFTPDQLSLLYQRTQGWAAGLSLLVSSLQRLPAQTDRETFFSHLRRTNRTLFDFLAEEVLNHQEPVIREFLLQTSLLSEMSPGLCRAITRNPEAANILEELFRLNLFITAVDTAATTFRYHDLFKEFLRQRITSQRPEELKELHRRAAQAEKLPSRQIHHLLEAQMWDKAAGLIEGEGERLVARGAFDTLKEWIAALPAETRERKPRLSFLLGVGGYQELDFGATSTRRYFELALKGFRQAGDRVGEGEALSYLLTYRLMSGDFEGALDYINRALALPVSPQRRVMVLMGRAWLELGLETHQPDSAWLDEALDLAENTPDPGPVYGLLSSQLPVFGAMAGGLARLERFLEIARSYLDRLAGPMLTAYLSVQTLISLWRGDWPRAIEAAEAALTECGPEGSLSWIMVGAGLFLPVYYALGGQNEQADTYLERQEVELQQPHMASFLKTWPMFILYQAGRTRLLQNRLEEAQQTLERMAELTNRQEWPISPALRLMLKGLIELSRENWVSAEAALQEAANYQEKMQLINLFGLARLHLAYVYLRQQHTEQALAELRVVLEQCRADNTPGRILWENREVVKPLLQLALGRGVEAEFAREVLQRIEIERQSQPSVLAMPAGLKIPESCERLTRREQEILILLASGLSNSEIAERLTISFNTVKRHVAHLYEKLEVSSRLQAVSRAKQLGLII